VKIPKRRIWQVLFLVLLNLPLLGPWKGICVPVLNCHSCPLAVFACPIGVLGHFAALGILPLFALGTISLIGVFFGRILCGWICPFGWLQDMLYKIPSPKWRLARWMRGIKYVLLIGTVFLVPAFLGLDSAAFYCWFCPVGTLESLLPRALATGNFAALAASWGRIVVLVAILLLAVVSLRSFCKVLCPIGAILAIFNRFCGFSLRYDQSKCSACELCLEECPMDVRIEDFRVSKPGVKEVLTAPSECILCFNCTKNCYQDGIQWTFWNLFGKKQKSSPGCEIANNEPPDLTGKEQEHHEPGE